MPQGDPSPRQLGLYLALAQVGLEMVVPVAAGIALDHYLAWGPWGAVAGACLGLVGGFLHLLALLRRSEEDDKKPDPPETTTS